MGGVLLRTAWAALAAAAWCLLVVVIDRAAPGPAARVLDSARFSPQIDDPQPRVVQLPHVWRDDCHDCTTAWYRIEMQIGELPRETPLVYLPAVGHNIALYLNGRLVGQSGRFGDPVARFDQRPLSYPVPLYFWQLGPNTLYVVVKADPASGGFLPALYLGPEAAIAGTMRLRSALRASLPPIVAAATAMLGLALAAVWAYRRHESAYGWFAAASAAWAAAQLDGVLVEPPLSAAVWDATITLLLALAAGLWIVVARVWHVRRSARDVLIVPAAVSLCLLPLAMGAPAVARAGALAGFALAGLAFVLHARRREQWNPWSVAASVPLVALAGHDMARALDWLPLPQGPLLAFAAPFVVGTVAWALLARFVETLNAVELLNIDLEDLVRQKTAALREQFEHSRRLERETVLANERERLMRDMHDGVGGHLVSTLAMIESGRAAPAELAAAVRGALDDMRLVIDSLDPVEGDLNAVLAMLADRLAPRLRAAGVTFERDIEPLPPLPDLGPARVLDILRLLQEAVTNVLKHARARRIVLVARSDPTGSGRAVLIRVEDDGVGFDPATGAGGRGLANQHRRALALGASLQIDSPPDGGTRVSLRLPTTPAPQRPAGAAAAHEQS
jgi:signal transduction histidine kinase